MGGPSKTEAYAFVRYFGRIVNFLNFFKYCVFTLGVYFVNNTKISTANDNAVWERFAKRSDKDDVWMPHQWESKDPGIFQKMQFFIGLIVSWAIFHVITYFLLSCWRWDKR